MSGTRAVLFPGQGSQAPGMGKQLAEASPAAREVFGEVDEALSQNLSRLMFEGPADELTLTANAQPAIMANSLAVLRILERDCGVGFSQLGGFTAGHSLGEYSALCAAGVAGLSDTARLLRVRGDAMQAAVPVGVGAMAALLGLDFADAEAAARAGSEGDEVCVAANDNAPGQVVISGHKAAVERAIEAAKELGAKRGMLLPVSAPFHSPLMAPAAERMEAALGEIAFDTPTVPIVTNVTAASETHPQRLKALLVDQVTGMVRWRESILAMADDGTETYVELGAKVVAPMVKRIAPGRDTHSLVSMDDIEAFAKTL
ncbi:[acyl-carrier-protein] S-malonyltransferase [Pacificimonas flava]|uniref:Malonyl CoA-acyl carrier protein transacylase n=2 Tax=Pacificimonas TaxID=1960290 RepID=A0A219B7N8_9SPHN|nr:MULTISPECIES: ACP S-malonyltransferase [Pacificimonas]MBZ6379870.1 ACP S-malonyltransferase [Pacificimonas aurantium]OWV34400.1 [acyl-carrier-protein] S-malonyltransferase [Pacificimonas flava]